MIRTPIRIASTVTALTWFSVCWSAPVTADNLPPTHIATPGGEIILSTPADRIAYDDLNFAPARRAGDFVYVSGAVAVRQPEGPRTAETFKDATRKAFEKLRARLRAFGVDFADVVMINSFHDWSAPEFNGDRTAQFTAFREVKAEFMPPPYPAWTAVGTSGLIRDAGIVEIQLIAFAPQKKAAISSVPEAPSSNSNLKGGGSSMFRRPIE